MHTLMEYTYVYVKVLIGYSYDYFYRLVGHMERLKDLEDHWIQTSDLI